MTAQVKEAYRSFKKGDRVKFIRLDGTLSDEAVELYDVWGDPDTPGHNASYLDNAGIEQSYHTDLLKREDDSSPVVVPDGGVWYIAIGNAFGWGRGRTEAAAIANMRKSSSGKPTAYTVYRVNKWTVVTGLGGLKWPRDGNPVEVKRVKPPAKSK